MATTWDVQKRARTLIERGLDFADADKVFAGLHFTRIDDRRDYGEVRFITVGSLRGRFVVLTWTPTGNDRRIISMRHSHAKEAKKFRVNLD